MVVDFESERLYFGVARAGAEPARRRGAAA